MPPNLFIHFDCWTNDVRSKKLKKDYRLIWHVVVWKIWRVKNDIIFNNGVIDVEVIVDKIKFLSRCLSRLKMATYVQQMVLKS